MDPDGNSLAVQWLESTLSLHGAWGMDRFGLQAENKGPTHCWAAQKNRKKKKLDPEQHDGNVFILSTLPLAQRAGVSALIRTHMQTKRSSQWPPPSLRYAPSCLQGGARVAGRQQGNYPALVQSKLAPEIMSRG